MLPRNHTHHIFKSIRCLVVCVFLFLNVTYSQNVTPTLPSVANFHVFNDFNPIPIIQNGSKSSLNKSRYAQQMAMHEADVRSVNEAEDKKKAFISDLDNARGYALNLEIPSHKNTKGTQYYRNAYAQLLSMQHGSFSPKKATFIVENAYYEDKKKYSEFEETIKKTGDFLREKMEELNLDKESNLAKNYLLFQFFADTLEVKSKGLKHFPFEYDFDDYSGKKDWSKMFVQKLLLTGKGQCNSLPKLYLILAEEIQAEAHLALSPNHSYIKFPDDNGTWHNIELTNNMLSTDAFILNSGYVKAEAIQNKIFMHPLNGQELLSNFFSELALGYVSKYGYDEFVQDVLNTALEIDAKNISAQLGKANMETIRLKYATERVGITKENFEEIRNYPQLVQLYKTVLSQYQTVDNLGYAEMPAELYEKWLSSINEQEAQQLNDSFRVKPIKKTKD